MPPYLRRYASPLPSRAPGPLLSLLKSSLDTPLWVVGKSLHPWPNTFTTTVQKARKEHKVNPLLTIALSISSAIISSLLTIYLTHYHFWKYQRRGELRLKAIEEVNRLTSDFIIDYMGEREHYVPAPEWYKSFQMAAAKVKALFSADTFKSFKDIEEMIGHNLGPEPGQRNVSDFIEAQDAALRSLYEEVGILPQGPGFFSRFPLRYFKFGRKKG